MTDCLFCKIIEGDIPANITYQDDSVIAFSDIIPQAPHHELIIPREHIATINDLTEQNASVISNMYLAATHLAKKLGIDKAGYRTLINCNTQGGQKVYHIHLHLLGGREMGWPPG